MVVLIRRWFYFAALLLFSITANAQQDELTIELKTLVPTLVASPELCEIDAGETICLMQASLLWEVPKAGEFCLWQEDIEQPLKCWDNAWSGTYSINFESGRSVTYLLTRGVNGTLAATTEIKVMTLLEQRLRAKRRRGFWRIF